MRRPEHGIDSPGPLAFGHGSLERLVRLGAGWDGASRIRVYALNRREGVPGLSRVEGPGPEVDRAAHGVPRGAIHALTLDLAEIPELARRFEGARLFSVFVPDPAAGRWNGWVVASPLVGEAPDLGGTPASPLELTPIDVRASAFAPARDEDDDEVLDLLHAQHGWVMGRPRWLTGPAAPDARFVMQFGGELGRRFAVPESGEVYVLDDRVVLQTR